MRPRSSDPSEKPIIFPSASRIGATIWIVGTPTVLPICTREIEVRSVAMIA